MLRPLDISDDEIEHELDEAVAHYDSGYVIQLIDEIESRGHEIEI